MANFASVFQTPHHRMDILTYWLFRIFILVFRIIPFSALYLFADFISFIIYHLTGYRKTVVFDNLRRSFPEMDESKRKKIAAAFYRHLADMLVESLKSFNLSEENVIKRYQYKNTGFLQDLYKEGKTVICVAGHYGNWEWGGIASGLQLAHRPVGFYKPLSNQYIDRYVQKTRVQGRSVLAPITRTAETFKADWGEPVIFYMVADQSPSSARLAYWIPFLNQETAVLHGPEKYARVHNFPVVFAYSKKLRRGYYEVEFSMLAENPEELKTGEITRRYMKKLEEVIISQPEYYLWSHRRWKLSKGG